MDQSSPAAGLHERSTGVAAISLLLDRLRQGRGSALFIAGEAGLGKTTLLRVAADRAIAGGVSVTRGRGQAMEVDLPFGLAAQALEPLGGGHLCGTVGMAEPAESRVSVWVRARAWLEEAARSAPVLLVLDDLHWSDPDSLELVAFLSRRVGRAPIGIVAALRTWPPAAHDLVDLLVQDGAAKRVELGPLSADSARRMLEELLGERGIDRGSDGDLAHRAWTLAGGNPFLIENLAKIIAVDGGLPEPDGLDLGEFRRVMLLSTFAALSHGAIEYARAASVLGSEFRLALVQPIAGTDIQDTADGLEALFRSGLLVETRHGWASFAHPLIAMAVYEDLTPVRRMRMHARAFEQLAGLGAVMLAAQHAVAADLVGDPAAVAVVTAAGEASLAAGAVLRALEHLKAAVALCAAHVPGRLWLRLAEAWMAAGKPAQAVGSCRSAISTRDLAGAERVTALRLLARALAFSSDMEGSGRAAQEALEYARTSAPETVGSVVLEQVHAVWQSAGPRSASALVGALCGSSFPDDPALRAMCSFIDYYADADGRALDELAALVGLGRDPAVGDDQNSPFDPMLLYLSVARLSEQFEQEHEVYVRARERAVAQGLVHAQVTLEISRFDSLLRQGRLADAGDVLDEVERLADVVPLMHEAISLSRAALACEVGDTGHARALLAAAGPEHLMWMTRVWAAHLGAAAALLDSGVDEACSGYLDLERLVDELGLKDPCVVPWALSAVRSYVRAGRLGDAERVCERVESVTGRLRARWPQLAAVAGRAAVAAARGAGSDAVRLYTEALALPVALPLERARVLLDFGSWLRRTNRPMAARDPLAEAVNIAERAGASGLAVRAAAELRVAGGRRRPRGDTREQLTAQELRVGELAAQVLTNVEVARELSLSVKTVETHLTRIYRKLGVRSKRELAAMLPPPGTTEQRPASG